MLKLMLMLMYKTKLTESLEYKTKLTESPAYAYAYDFIGTVGTWKCSSACTNDCSTERSGDSKYSMTGEIPKPFQYRSELFLNR